MSKCDFHITGLQGRLNDNIRPGFIANADAQRTETFKLRA